MMIGSLAIRQIVCFCVSSRLENHKPIFAKFLRMMAMVRSSSDGVAIRKVLPVLWMISLFSYGGARIKHDVAGHCLWECHWGEGC